MADYLVNLEPDEHIVHEIRRHMFVFYNRIFVIFILFIAPIFVSRVVVSYLNELTGRGLSIFVFFYLVWFLVLWLFFFFRWTDYYLDVWVLTNKRIFDVEQKGFFSRSMSVFRLERIEDITINVDGLLATFLKYGDIHIHTAGAHDSDGDGITDLTINTAKDPLIVKQLIMDAHGDALRRIGADGIVRHHVRKDLSQETKTGEEV